MTKCTIWYSNNFDDISDQVELNNGEWVGVACLLTPGMSAALSPYKYKFAVTRPLTILNSAIPSIQILEKEGRKIAEIRNMEIGEFNACIPMLSDEDHIGGTRLALHVMRFTTQGQKAFSEMFCGVSEL